MTLLVTEKNIDSQNNGLKTKSWPEKSCREKADLQKRGHQKNQGGPSDKEKITPRGATHGVKREDSNAEKPDEW